MGLFLNHPIAPATPGRPSEPRFLEASLHPAPFRSTTSAFAIVCSAYLAGTLETRKASLAYLFLAISIRCHSSCLAHRRIPQDCSCSQPLIRFAPARLRAFRCLVLFCYRTKTGSSQRAPTRFLCKTKSLRDPSALFKSGKAVQNEAQRKGDCNARRDKPGNEARNRMLYS